jgi:bifunctional non-homologous end joining protein LigD
VDDVVPEAEVQNTAKAPREGPPDAPGKPRKAKQSQAPSKRGSGKPAAKATPADVQLPATKAKLTHLDKVYWPETGTTKGQLLAYYAAVAEWMLPFLKNRPLSLNRYPNGIEGHSFFQKDVDFKVPAFVKTADIYSESNAQDLTWLVANNRDTLLYVANLGSIEINPWNSRLGKLDRPDYTVVDLDPDTNSFEEVVALAQLTRKVLDRFGVEGYCKTSGKTGLHVYIPLGAKYTYEQAKDFTHVLARLLHAQSPANTSLERLPAKRKGRVYLDYLQNRTGQTLAAPYSVRPVPGAPVSTPLKWSEVKQGLDPARFTMFNTLQRLEKVGDLWAPVLGPGIDLRAVLEAVPPAGSRAPG